MARLPSSIDQETPRCGTCWAPATRTADNEGYSSCCNDRIEDPYEYLSDPEFYRAVDQGEVTS